MSAGRSGGRIGCNQHRWTFAVETSPRRTRSKTSGAQMPALALCAGAIAYLRRSPTSATRAQGRRQRLRTGVRGGPQLGAAAGRRARQPNPTGAGRPPAAPPRAGLAWLGHPPVLGHPPLLADAGLPALAASQEGAQEQRARRRRLLSGVHSARIRRGMIRFVELVLDLSR